MARICERISHGELVRDAAKAEGVSVTTVWTWAHNDDALSKLYTRAKEQAADALAEEALEVARGATNENAQAKRLLVDTLKWAAAKRRPKEYGDKVDVTSNGERIVSAVVALPLEELTAAMMAPVGAPEHGKTPADSAS